MGKGMKIVGLVLLVVFIALTGYAAVHNHQDDAAAERAKASCEGAVAQYSEELTHFEDVRVQWEELDTALDRVSSRVDVDRSQAQEIAATDFRTFDAKDCTTQGGRRNTIDYISSTEVLATADKLTQAMADLRTQAEDEIREIYDDLVADVAAEDEESVTKPELPKLNGTLEEMVGQLTEAEEKVEAYLGDVEEAHRQTERKRGGERESRTKDQLERESGAREDAERDADRARRDAERSDRGNDAEKAKETPTETPKK